MRFFPIAVLALFLALPSHADVLVHLKDGRTITVPVEPDEERSVEFVRGSKAAKLPPASTSAGPQVWKVGPGLPLAAPSAAAKVAQNGDTVEIAAAIYDGDVAVWRQSNLTLKGMGGRPHLRAAGRAAQGKAIWVIRGNNVRIENIEFSGTAVDDHNGAAIRGEGNGLTLDGVSAHDNQMGIMIGKFPDSDVVITKSQFYNNYVRGRSRPIGHNIYIGNVRSFTLTQSKVYGARIGHNVKSRARQTIIANNAIFDGADGRASYQIDLAAGGIARIEGNRIEQGTAPENTTLLSYGAEEAIHAKNRLAVIGNVFRNAYRSGTFVHNHMDIPAELKGNKMIGAGAILRGKGTIDGK